MWRFWNHILVSCCRFCNWKTHGYKHCIIISETAKGTFNIVTGNIQNMQLKHFLLWIRFKQCINEKEKKTECNSHCLFMRRRNDERKHDRSYREQEHKQTRIRNRESLKKSHILKAGDWDSSDRNPNRKRE